MSILTNNVLAKACKIFEVDSDSSLFESTDEEEEIDLDETYCEEAEEMLSQERRNRETSNTLGYSLKLHLAHEESDEAQNIQSAFSEKLVPGDIRSENEAFEGLWTAMLRCNQKPTMDGFMSCFKKFKRSTLVRLSLALEEHLKRSEKGFKKGQEAKLWYKNFKLTDEERGDSLRRLREIADEHSMEPDAGPSTND